MWPPRFNKYGPEYKLSILFQSQSLSQRNNRRQICTLPFINLFYCYHSLITLIFLLCIYFFKCIFMHIIFFLHLSALNNVFGESFSLFLFCHSKDIPIRDHVTISPQHIFFLFFYLYFIHFFTAKLFPPSLFLSWIRETASALSLGFIFYTSCIRCWCGEIWRALWRDVKRLGILVKRWGWVAGRDCEEWDR